MVGTLQRVMAGAVTLLKGVMAEDNDLVTGSRAETLCLAASAPVVDCSVNGVLLPQGAAREQSAAARLRISTCACWPCPSSSRTSAS